MIAKDVPGAEVTGDKGRQCKPVCWLYGTAQIARFMGPTWSPPGSCRPQMGPMLAP